MPHHISHITVALGITTLLAGCSGRTTAVKMTEERSQSSVKAGLNPRLQLIGCVKTAPSPAAGRYILAHIVPPPGELDPAEVSGNGPRIPRGSWVRLSGQDLKPYLGKQVEISGDLLTSSAIGTSGQIQSGQKADMPAGSVAAGDVPEIAVETIKQQADSCSEQ